MFVSGCPNQECKDKFHALLVYHVAGWPSTSAQAPRPEDLNLWCMLCDAWCVQNGVPQTPEQMEAQKSERAEPDTEERRRTG